jgi:hypothetical protein
MEHGRFSYMWPVGPVGRVAVVVFALYTIVMEILGMIDNTGLNRLI